MSEQISVKELRIMLGNLTNQNMTVKDLRRRLFVMDFETAEFETISNFVNSPDDRPRERPTSIDDAIVEWLRDRDCFTIRALIEYHF